MPQHRLATTSIILPPYLRALLQHLNSRLIICLHKLRNVADELGGRFGRECGQLPSPRLTLEWPHCAAICPGNAELAAGRLRAGPQCSERSRRVNSAGPAAICEYNQHVVS